jgi:hypothetical protein
MHCLTSVIALGLLVSAAAMASEGKPTGYLPPGDERAGGARHIVLIYNSKGHRKWRTDDFKPLLAYVGRHGKPMAPMFDTFLVLPLGLENGHWWCPGFGSAPADKVDVEAYRDRRLFGGDDQLRSLDRAAGETAVALSAPAMRYRVILTLPYPDPAQSDFGKVAEGGASLDFSRREDRLAETQWYIRTVRKRWTEAGFKHLELIGWYWVHEQTDGDDGALLPQVAEQVHADGGRFFWIPWFKAPGAQHAALYGFDAAMHQPNYFFDSYKGPATRLNEAAAFARTHNLGMELELDENVLKPERADSRGKYRGYLRVGREAGFQNGALTAWYMGSDALLRCAQSADPEARASYDDTWAFLSGT